MIDVDVTLINAFFSGAKGKHARVRRFQTDYVRSNKDIYSFDSENETKLAYKMYIDDILKVRQKVILLARSAYEAQYKLEDEITHERNTFMEEAYGNQA